MKNFIAGFALMASPACATVAPQQNQLDAIVSAHTEARGGVAAIDAVRGIELELDVVEPSFRLDARYVSNRIGCMRIDAFMNGRHALSEGLGSSGGWAAAGGATATRPQPEGGAATLRHGIENPTRLIGLHEFRTRGHSLTYAGRVEIGGQSLDKLVATYNDGYTAEIFLDPQTHLITRMREHKPMHLEADPTKLHIETQFSDFRSVGNVVFPFRSREVNWQTGQEL